MCYPINDKIHYGFSYLIIYQLGHKISNGFLEDNEELILEISRRYAKYPNDEIVPEVEGASIQDFCRIIKILVDCCDEHDWFRTEN